MLNLTLSFAIVILFLNVAYGQKVLRTNPNEAIFVTTDIANFWQAYDSAKGKDIKVQEQIYQSLYLDQASVGFQSWIDKRNKKVAELVEGINSLLPFYESIRENTLKVKAYEKDIRAGFYAMKHLYPEAAFPDVYFFIWYFFNSGSTTSDAGLLIAAETQTIAEDTPLDQFPEVQREIVRSLNLKGMSSLVAHESVHMQQPDTDGTTLLEKSIKEGVADFIAELATGYNPSQSIHHYGNANKKALYRQFQQEMNGRDTGTWMYYIPKDRPPALGYWIGYNIVSAFYEKQEDKPLAIKRLITTTDYQSIFQESGYAKKFVEASAKK